MHRLVVLAAALVVLVTPSRVTAGWTVEIETRTEGTEGPASRTVLAIANGRIREIHDDGSYFLWDLGREKLFQVDPSTETYAGGDIAEMVASVEGYLADLRSRLTAMSPEEREELAAKTKGLPMPVPLPDSLPSWTVVATGRSSKIAGLDAELFEVRRDGVLFEERWIASSFDFGEDLDWPRYARFAEKLENAFERGMGTPTPEGAAFEALRDKGFELRSTIFGDGFRVVTEVVEVEAREVPPDTFTVPPTFRLRSRSAPR